MAEQAPGIQNTRQLIVALALGALVVLAQNIYISKVRQEGRGRMVKILKVKRDAGIGETLSRTDLDVVSISSEQAKSLGNVVYAKDLGLATSVALTQPVQKNNFLWWSNINPKENRNPANLPRPGYTNVQIQMDPRNSPGTIVRPGDTVDVLGVVTVNGQRGYQPLITGVRVLAIEGVGRQEDTQFGRRRPNDSARASYARVAIEVRKDISTKLYNLLSRVNKSEIFLRRVSPPRDPAVAGQINPKLENLAETAAGPSNTMAGGFNN